MSNPLLDAADRLEAQAAAAMDLATELEVAALELRAHALGAGQHYATIVRRAPYGKSRETVRDALMTMPEATVAQVVAQTGLSTGIVNKRLVELYDAGSLSREREDGRASYLYRLIKPTGPTPARPRRTPPEAEVVKRSRNGSPVAGTGQTRPVNKEVGELLEACTKAGAQIEKAGKHWKVTVAGKTIATVPATPSDHRALKNCRADLRRQGLEI